MSAASIFVNATLEAVEISKPHWQNPFQWIAEMAIVWIYSYHYFLHNYRCLHTILHVALLAGLSAQIHVVCGFGWALFAWVMAVFCDFNQEF